MRKVTKAKIENVEENIGSVKSQFLAGCIVAKNISNESKISIEKEIKNEAKVIDKTVVSSNKKTKKIKNKFLKKLVILIVVIICIIIGLIVANNLYVNSKVCELAYKNDSKIINVKTYINNISLQDKAIQALQKNNKEIRVEYNGNYVTIPSNKISKNLKIGINTKNKVNDISEFKDMKCLYIQNIEFSTMTVKLPKYLIDKKVVDIYVIKENNKVELYRKSVELNGESSITVESIEGAIGYVVIYIPVQDISLKNQSDTIYINKNAPADIMFNFTPVNATLQSVKYESLDGDIITINDNKIVGLKYGKGKIRVTNENGEFLKEFNIMIDKYITDINVKVQTINLQVGKKIRLEYTVIPNDAISSDIIIESSNPEIAKIDGNDIIGVSEGVCKIIVKTATGSYIEKQINIEIYNNDVNDNIEKNEKLTIINGILIVNKTYKLPISYNPGLDSETLNAFSKMKVDAAKEGVKLWSTSDYRSYKVQNDLYASYVRTKGKKGADNCAARPGYSEHQTGLAIDVNTSGDAFASSTESNWLAKNSYKYGFIVRYPAGKEKITGYKYEPWHIRYIGVENAKKVYESGLCLEEYLGISSQYEE